MSKQTPLYAAHLAAQAKIVDFAGWQMPLHYGSQLDEHFAVRNTVGMFDVSHMGIIDLSGEQALLLLSGLLANDPYKLQSGKAMYSCMLDLNGGVIDDLIVYQLAAESYRLVVNAACTDKDLAWIRQQAHNFAVNISLRTDLGIIAVQGPQATKVLQLISPEFDNAISHLNRFASTQVGDFFIARTGYTGENGFEVIAGSDKIKELWSKLLTLEVQPIGLGARDTLRLEAGLNLYGNDMDINTTPLETNLAWTVAMEPLARNFNGRESLESQQYTGLKRKLVGVKLQDRVVLRHGQKILQYEQEVGAITSGGYSPTLQTSIGFALLQLPIGADYVVDVRGTMHPLQIVKLPFLKK